MIVMNYTLQFIRPLDRPAVLQQCFDGLNLGGILVLSEKILEQSGMTSRLFNDMYYRYKRRMGYSELEISRKREQLENVLVPYKVDEYIELLKSVGFDHVGMFFKWHNFASFIAIRSL